MNVWDHLLHFRREEFGVHADKMDPLLLHRLDRARERAGVPFVITDSWRKDMPGASAHELGKAVDLRCHNSHIRYKMLAALLEVGFTRVGVYDLHLHCDVATPADGFPQGVIWTGASR